MEIAGLVLQLFGIGYLAFDYWKINPLAIHAIQSDWIEVNWAISVGKCVDNCTSLIPKWIGKAIVRKIFRLNDSSQVSGYPGTRQRVLFIFFVFAIAGLFLQLLAVILN